MMFKTFFKIGQAFDHDYLSIKGRCLKVASCIEKVYNAPF